MLVESWQLIASARRYTDMNYKGDLSDMKDVKSTTPLFAAGKRGSYVCHGHARVRGGSIPHRYIFYLYFTLPHVYNISTYEDQPDNDVR
jgi:hypothetical protein